VAFQVSGFYSLPYSNTLIGCVRKEEIKSDSVSEGNHKEEKRSTINKS
jgi:hypothetical protein